MHIIRILIYISWKSKLFMPFRIVIHQPPACPQHQNTTPSIHVTKKLTIYSNDQRNNVLLDKLTRCRSARLVHDLVLATGATPPAIDRSLFLAQARLQQGVGDLLAVGDVRGGQRIDAQRHAEGGQNRSGHLDVDAQQGARLVDDGGQPEGVVSNGVLRRGGNNTNSSMIVDFTAFYECNTIAFNQTIYASANSD